jgi:hypothetical protein
MSTTTKRRRGRPFKSYNPGDIAQIRVFLEPSVKLRINERVQKTGRRLPEELQELIVRGLAAEHQDAFSTLLSDRVGNTS